MTLARPPEAKASAKDVFINHERKSEVRRRSDTALVLTVNDNNHQFVDAPTLDVVHVWCAELSLPFAGVGSFLACQSLCSVDGRHEQLPHTR